MIEQFTSPLQLLTVVLLMCSSYFISTTVSNCNGEVNCSIIKNDVDNFSQSYNDIDNDFIISK
jgi:hypothetical protein